MADAYGTIVVSTDSNFEGNLNALATILSELDFTNYNEGFSVNNDKIWINSTQTQYPTLFPIRPLKVAIYSDKSVKQKFFSEMDELDWDSDWESIEDETVPLSVIAKSLSSNIQKGTLFLACCSNEKNRYVSSESLEINADGTAKRTSFFQAVGMTPVINVEHV